MIYNIISDATIQAYGFTIPTQLGVCVGVGVLEYFRNAGATTVTTKLSLYTLIDCCKSSILLVYQILFLALKARLCLGLGFGQQKSLSISAYLRKKDEAARSGYMRAATSNHHDHDGHCCSHRHSAN